MCKDSAGIISSAADNERQKKLGKVKKMAVKAIFEQAHNKYFHLKFLIAWMQTSYNFAQWKRSYGEYLWANSEQSGYVHSAKVYLENGEIYNGSL